MKKTLSAILATAMLITALPMSVIHAEENDAYFTEQRTVDYSGTWYNAKVGNGYATAENAANYKFTVGTENFSLLDVSQDSDSKYFVITSTSVAGFPFYANTDVVNYFDNVSGSGDAHAKKYPSWALNGEYFKNGWVFNSFTGISSTVRDYIDFSHEWTCEKSLTNEEYKITAGIAYPSANEISTYSDRFLVQDTTAPFVMRTLRNQAGARFGIINATGADNWKYQAVALGESASWQKVRPVFWLNDEFFANVPVDLATAGAAVKQEIKKQDVSELLEIYTEADLETYLDMEVYTVSVETLSGEAIAYGETLKASVDGKDSSVTWQRVDASGNIEDIVTSEEYIVTEVDMGYSIQATDGNVTSTPAVIESYVNTYNTNSAYKMNKTSDANALFKVKGSEREFVLAKTFNNEESKYFVAANEAYGAKQWYTDGREVTLSDGSTVALTPIWNPEAGTDDMLAYWMNGTFIKSGNGVTLPAEIVEYINMNHIWRTEGTTTRPSDNIESYVCTAGVVAPSFSELQHYTKIGYNVLNYDGTSLSSGKIFSRTPVDRPSASAYQWSLSFYLTSTSSNDTQCYTNHTTGASNGIRPVFYLKDGFFANVAVDLETAGADVLEEIKKEDIDALRALYQDAELTTYLGLDLSQYPEIKTYSGEALAYGETVYSTVLDATWKINNEEISVLNNSYIITEADAGKTIAVEYAKDGKVYTNSYDIPALENAPHSPNNAITASKESENIIKVDGRSFTVVDDFNNKKSTFFVVANEIYGNYGITSRKMDPAADGNVMKYLNGTFKTAGTEDGKKLPQNIINYIDNDHIWLTEGTPLFTADPMESYTFTAGISIPSTSEIKRYKDTFGWYATAFDGAAFAPYWTRTAANHATGEWVYVASGGAQNDIQVVMSHWKLDGSTGIRPEFYLNEDFFRNVAIDNFSDLTRDSALTKMLTSRYSMEEMYALYGPKGQDIFDKQGLLDLGFVSDGSNFEVSFKNADNREFDTLEGQTEICAEIAVTAGKKDVNTVAIFALYDDEERLVATNFANVDVAPGESKNVPVKLTGLSNITSEYTAKVMFVKDLLTLTPNFDEVSFIEANINSVKALSFDMGKETDNSAGGYNFF